ncbi:MAG: DNA-directed RNA polymerase subunit omega [Defluviitaleaceae bacterium]|nr:DNA-directed RNA polymerase subunit omega [Defluviitaleaceae bacterium]
MTKINQSETTDDKITSRYTIVLATAKRARQLIDGALPLCYAPTDKPVSISVKEMYEGKLKIIDRATGEDEYYRIIREQMMKEVDNLADTF